MTTIAQSAGEKQTRAFIDIDPVDVVLQRKKATKTAAGGLKHEKDYNMMPQRCRIIHSSNLGAAVTRMTPDGRTLIIRATAMFLPGADVEVGDVFQGEEPWEVASVSRTPPWRVTAELG